MTLFYKIQIQIQVNTCMSAICNLMAQHSHDPEGPQTEHLF